MIVFDLETNGLYHDVTRIHCIALYDTESNQTEVFNDECPGQGMSNPVVRAVQYLEQADCIAGHNVINYDLPVIRKLYPFFSPLGTVVDTLVLSRLYHSDLMRIDKEKNWPDMPLQLYGRHSLEAYGYRLNEYKGTFGKTTDWKEWSQDMQDYCIQDVVVTKKLCDHFHPYLSGSKWNTR